MDESQEQQNESTVNSTISNNSGTLHQNFPIHDPSNEPFSNYGKIEVFHPNKIRNTIQAKIRFLSNLHEFFLAFSNSLYEIYSRLHTTLVKKMENTLDQNKNFLKFFKETISCYERFSSDLLKAKMSLTSSVPNDKLFFNEINPIIESSQEKLSSNLLSYTQILNEHIMIRGPFTRVKEFYERITEFTKDVNDDLLKIGLKKEKLSKKFKSLSTIIEEFKSIKEDDEEEFIAFLNKYEILILEISHTTSINHINDLIKSFLVNYIKVVEEMKSLMNDFYKTMKDTIEIYINASKIIFLDYTELDKIQKTYNDITPKVIESSFKPSVLFNDQLNDFNLLFKKFHNSTKNNEFIKNEEILDEKNFVLEKYETFDDLFFFILKIIPDNYHIEKSSLISFMNEVKYGSSKNFNSFKSGMMLLSVQNNIFIFEKRIKKNWNHKFSLLSFKYNEKLNEKKNDMFFELSDDNKGFFSTNKKIYLEALNRDRFNEIRNVFSYYLKYVGTTEPFLKNK